VRCATWGLVVFGGGVASFPVDVVRPLDCGIADYGVFESFIRDLRGCLPRLAVTPV